MKPILCFLAAASSLWGAHTKRAVHAVPDLSRSTVIHDVAVVDVETGSLAPHRNVYVRGEKIVFVGPAARPAKSARVVSGAGKYLIPGLWDMHVHLWNQDPQFSLFLASGVTGVRDMGSTFARVREWRAQIQRGAITGPRIFTSGSPLDGPDDATDARFSVRTIRSPEEARRAFDDLDDMHVDFIEVLPGLSAQAFFALTEFTRHWGHRIAGNLPDTVSALQAIDARQGSIEDLEGVLLSCSSEEREIRSQWREARRAHDGPALDKSIQAMVDTYSKGKAAQIFGEMRIYDVLATPMLIARKRAPAPTTTEYDRLAALAREMGNAGVGLLAGTDTGVAGSEPGVDLHEELELMVQAGLTPAQALRAATIQPAHVLRHDADLGTIRPEKYADLVLLDENPLTDIANTRKIAGVFVSGRYLARSELAAMRAQAAKRAETQ